MQATQQVTDLGICEMLGCPSQAVKEVKVTLSKGGFIRLFLCETCAPKFQAKKSGGDVSANRELPIPGVSRARTKQN